MPYSFLILGRPLLLLPFIFPSIRDFSNECFEKKQPIKCSAIGPSFSFKGILLTPHSKRKHDFVGAKFTARGGVGFRMVGDSGAVTWMQSGPL